jgi:hypothetical protein
MFDDTNGNIMRILPYLLYENVISSIMVQENN